MLILALVLRSTRLAGTCFPVLNCLFELSTATTEASFSLHDWRVGIHYILSPVLALRLPLRLLLLYQIFGQRVYRVFYLWSKTVRSDLWSMWSMWSLILGLTPHSDTRSGNQPVTRPPFAQLNWSHKWVLTVLSVPRHSGSCILTSGVKVSLKSCNWKRLLMLVRWSTGQFVLDCVASEEQDKQPKTHVCTCFQCPIEAFFSLQRLTDGTVKFHHSF